METYFDFEKPIAELEKKLEEMRELSQRSSVDLKSEIKTLEKKVGKLIEETYQNLTPWQRVMLSRHANRPYSRDYIENLFPDFMEMAGDRTFGNDKAIMAGLASWPPQNLKNPQSPKSSVVIIAHQKGRTTKQKMEQNFGMARPEGYRKAIRLMELAERLRIPIVTFIDTPGAYPGLETEERGQAQAIAESIRTMFKLTVPVISLVIGEGGSGGALAIGCGNRVLMMEFSTYSVISPEGCASILWSDASYASQASECLKMSPRDLLEFGVIDEVVKEPVGGAHRDWPQTFTHVAQALDQNLAPYLKMDWSNIEISDQERSSTASSKHKSSSAKAAHKGSAKTTSKSAKAAPPQRRSPALPPSSEYGQRILSSVARKIRKERIDKFRYMGLNALAVTQDEAQ